MYEVIDTSLLDSHVDEFMKLGWQARNELGLSEEDITMAQQPVEETIRKEINKQFGRRIVHISGIEVLALQRKEDRDGDWLQYESTGFYGFKPTYRSFVPGKSRDLLPWMILETVDFNIKDSELELGIASLQEYVAIPLTTPYIAHSATLRPFAD
jgi:hypothetical protein